MDGQLLAEARWRWAAASEIGTSHLKTGTRKQDAYKVFRPARDVLCAIVSDGAGSAVFGGEGASVVCRSLARQVDVWFANHSGLPVDEQLHDWMDVIRDRLGAAAGRRSIARRQFAATLVTFIATPQQTLTMQVGDSPLVARFNGAWRPLCWPENGEFASTTYFVTDDPQPRLHIGRFEDPFDAFALFSDGLDGIALEHATQSAYPRFLDPMIKPVDDSASSGRILGLSTALGNYLSGKSICERTDDDKTLVLISRK